MKKFISHSLSCSQHGSHVYFMWSTFQISQGLNIHQAHCKFKQVVINRTNQDVITEEVFMKENYLVEISAIAESEETDTEIEVELKPNLPPYANASSVVKSTTNSLNGLEFVETIP